MTKHLQQIYLSEQDKSDILFGVENDVHIDIPRGSVRGMVNDKTSSTGKSLGQGAVGRNTMLVYPPHTK